MAWIAALVSAAAGAASSKKQKDAAKKANNAASAELSQSGNLSREQMAQALQQYQQNVGPYQAIGGQAMNSLGGLLGLEGYRTKSDIALRDLNYKGAPVYEEPVYTPGEIPGKYKITPGSKEAMKMGALQALDTGAFFRSKSKKKKQARAAAAQAEAQNAAALAAFNAEKIAGKAKYDQDLAAWNTQKSDLEKQRDLELQTYDPTAQLRATPGYQFRYNTGENAVQAGQAARHNVFSGRAGKELTQYGQDFASNEFGNEVNRLSGLMGLGFNASTGLGNAALGQGNNIATGTLNQGNSLAQLLGQQGNNNANYYNNLNNVVQGGLSNYLTDRNVNKRKSSIVAEQPYGTSRLY